MPVNGKAAGPSFDKVAHTLLFCFVSINACFYFINNKKHFLIAMLFILTLPLMTEYVQTFIPGRNFENLDILADCIGIILGALIYFLLNTPLLKFYSFLGETQPA